MNYSENYLINTKLNLKTRFVQEKRKHVIISEMSGSALDICPYDTISIFVL